MVSAWKAVERNGIFRCNNILEAFKQIHEDGGNKGIQIMCEQMELVGLALIGLHTTFA